MDSVMSPETAIALGRHGGLGVLNLEGLWTRYEDPTDLIAEIAELDAGTVVSAEHVSAQAEPLNLKEFIYELDVPVIVGGCATYQAALHLMRTGAAGVLVGFGGGAAHTTRGVLGVAVPMASAVGDVAAPGRGWHWGSEAHHPELPRGLRVRVGTVGTIEEVLLGPSTTADGSMSFVGALRRAMATTGYSDLKAFQK